LVLDSFARGAHAIEIFGPDAFRRQIKAADGPPYHAGVQAG
jgi:hypothetical protein